MTELIVRVRGADRILRNLDRDNLIGPPWRTALEKSALTVESAAKKRAPKWRRVLMGAIESQVDKGAIPLEAKIGVLRGPATAYAPAMEFGRRPGRFPPIAAIAEWTASKGISIPPFIIARAIARGRSRHQRRGGFKYLRRGLEESRRAIEGFFNRAARDIEARWRSR